MVAMSVPSGRRCRLGHAQTPWIAVQEGAIWALPVPADAAAMHAVNILRVKFTRPPLKIIHYEFRSSSPMSMHLFTPAEQRQLRTLRTPGKIQRFLDTEIGYNKEPDGPTCRSPRLVLRDRIAHCMEGALLACAALAAHGQVPMLVDLEAVRDDDHVLAVFRERGHWGAIAKSNYASLRYREPVYRTVRELVMSYFEHYHNLAGEKSLRRYSRPVRLSRFGEDWMTAESPVWHIPEHLCKIPHIPLITTAMERHLNPLDARLRASEQVGMQK